MRSLYLAITLIGGYMAGIITPALLYVPPPAVVAVPEVVRMLDVTIKDSNTTGRRQRFVCRPEESRR